MKTEWYFTDESYNLSNFRPKGPGKGYDCVPLPSEPNTAASNV